MAAFKLVLTRLEAGLLCGSCPQASSAHQIRLWLAFSTDSGQLLRPTIPPSRYPVQPPKGRLGSRARAQPLTSI